MSDLRVRWQLYRYHNRAHRGEIWLVFRVGARILLMEQTGERPKGSEVLGEVRTLMIDGDLVDDIVPLQQRSAAESRRMKRQAEEHKAFRAELYSRYPIGERIRDLRSAQ